MLTHARVSHSIFSKSNYPSIEPPQLYPEVMQANFPFKTLLQDENRTISGSSIFLCYFFYKHLNPNALPLDSSSTDNAVHV